MFNPESFPALNINAEAVRHANDASMFEAGTHRAREAEQAYRPGLEAFVPDSCPVETWTEEQQAIAQRRAVEWRELCEKSFNDVISRRASWVPVIVAGPSGYNSRREGKKAEAEMRAASEWSEKRERFLENTRRMIENALPLETIIAQYRTGKRREAISGDDPAAVEKLEARIAFLNDEREEGKRQNAYWRKYKTMRGYVCRDGSTIDARADEIDSGIRRSMYGVPCPPYELQNTLQNVKRLEDRLNEARQRREMAKEADAGTRETEYNGFSVEIAAADARIYLHFDGKPDEDARKVLKENGFHWSPRLKVWTRQHTGNAERALRRYVIPGLIATGKYSEKTPDAPEAVSLDEFAAQYAQD